MRVGLIDVDGFHADRRRRRGSIFPNLALMKLSAYHKAQGDDVEWWDALVHYDRVYMSKVFTFSPDIEVYINADEVVRGGTGYKDYDTVLPPEIEDCFPDYSLYPDADYAIGFLTRGCIRACPWCVVPKKEGRIRPNATWREIRRPDTDKVVFLDNNVLACQHGLEQIEEMGDTREVKVDFNQGLDARLVTPEVARLLARLRWIRQLRFACDTSAMLPVIEKTVGILGEAGINPWKIFVYALAQDLEEAHNRVIALDRMGVDPYVQPYRDIDDGGEPSDELKRFARWVNRKETFHSTPWEEYNTKTLGRKAE